MRKPTVEEARGLCDLLTDIRTEASRSRATLDDARSASPPLDDLLCLLSEADRIPDIGTHLLTVCRMAFRDVRTRCHMGWWRTAPEYRVTEHLARWSWLAVLPQDRSSSWYHPFFILSDIRWSSDGFTLPREVWLTEGEVSQQVEMGLSGSDAVDAAFCARHAVPATYTMRTVMDHLDGEERDA
jgi:hypothetical protein